MFIKISSSIRTKAGNTPVKLGDEYDFRKVNLRNFLFTLANIIDFFAIPLKRMKTKFRWRLQILRASMATSELDSSLNNNNSIKAYLGSQDQIKYDDSLAKQRRRLEQLDEGKFDKRPFSFLRKKLNIGDQTLCEYRAGVERRKGEKSKLVSSAPTLITSEEANRDVDEIISREEDTNNVH